LGEPETIADETRGATKGRAGGPQACQPRRRMEPIAKARTCMPGPAREARSPTPGADAGRGLQWLDVRVITTHLSADFDAFAAAVCAVRLFPEYRVLFPGSQEAAVRRFLSDSGLPYPELRLREARSHTWEHAVVVDTRTPRRLGESWEIIERDSCPVTLIDHHPSEEEELGAVEVISREVGATCTIIASLLRERGLGPTAEEASLLLMGIYEDTGGLSYHDTTPADLREVAWLLEQGGSLEWVRRWVLKALQPDQLELLNRLVEGTEEVRIHDVPVAFSLVEVDRYHEEAAYVVHRWVETFEIPVGIVMLVRPPHINLILRSRLEGLHVGRLAQRFGGGGHATAAAARVTDRMAVELREELVRALDEELPPPTRAIDAATRQVFVVETGTPVEETKERMNQLRVNALPVQDPGTEELVGMVTRQILDRAVSHGMGDRPVSAVMQPGVPRVPGETSLAELRDMFLERSHRFVLVEEGGEVVGLVTRMDLFRRLFERQHRAGASLDHRIAGARPVTQSVVRFLRDVSPDWVQSLLDQARRVADEQGISVYLVGGVVRDLLLGRANEDVDLVVEGGGVGFAEALAAAAGGRSHPHEPFLSAVLTLPDGHKVDVVSARTEFYRTPAALPEVETSLIRQDLFRRDFTMNALAVALGGARHGELVDYFGGRKDIQRKEIRVLHSLSFIDDPTRAIRAVRYARRLQFNVAPDTRHLITTAIGEGVFERLSGQRLRRELELLLAEPHPAQSVALLAELGLVSAILPDLVWHEGVRAFLSELDGQVAWYELEGLGGPPEPWLLYLGGLTLHAGPDTGSRLAARLKLTGDQRQRLVGLREAVLRLRQAAGPGLSRSARVRRVEEEGVEVMLLAMAGLRLEERRVLADAVEASVRIHVQVRGRDLLESGVAPGPQLGEALLKTRDALIDGEIGPDRALEHAIAMARKGQDGSER